MAPENPAHQYPLYNTTFTLHRLSPLYTGSNVPLNNSTLYQHARQFRDILAGEVLRGVQVGLVPEDNQLARAGPLRTVTWRLLPEEEDWTADDETESGIDDTNVGLKTSRGILITVIYEKIMYKAILWRAQEDGGDNQSSISTARDEDGFQHFPLLMSKMPVPLRETFSDYLSTTFDTRVSPLQFSSTFLTNSFERYLSDISVNEEGTTLGSTEQSYCLKKIIRETILFVGFDLPVGSLKTIDIQISQADLPRMVPEGTNVENSGNTPFLDALAYYVMAHLSLDLRHEDVKIIRIACGAFVIGGDGRIKITQPLGGDGGGGGNPQSRATRRLMYSLFRAAEGGVLSVGNGVP